MLMKDRHGDHEIDTSFIKNPEVHREETDVNIRPILWFGVWLTVATAVIYVILAGLYWYFEEREAGEDSIKTPLAGERKRIPDEPRLQLAPTEVGQRAPQFIEDHPLRDMRDLREKENAVLHNYGWVNEQGGIVHIPIEDAMKMVLEQGQQALPSRAGSQTQPAAAQSGQVTRGGADKVTTGASEASEKAQHGGKH